VQEALRVVGKLAVQPCINTVTPGSLFHIKDQLTHRRFLCDTGESYSILPHQSLAVASGPPLHDPAGRPIKCCGERELTLTFNNKQYKWIFLLADVSFAIIGIDFLKHFKLVVDAAAGQLIDTRTMAVIPAAPGVDRRSTAASRGSLFCAVGTVPPAYRGLLEDFQDVLNPTGDLLPPTHEVEHQLITKGRPVTARFRRLEPEKHEATRAAFAKLEKQGIIRSSNSCWASPLHMVRKADGSGRPCGDFRQLNLIMEPDQYPLPRMDDLMGRLKGCNIFTKLDLKQGYHQIPMAAADVKKTAIITPFGLFEFVRMPFGLRNAGHKLTAAQTRYSAFDRELLAIYRGIRYFRYMLEGRRLIVFTDHKPLTFALHKQAEPWTARQQRHLGLILISLFATGVSDTGGQFAAGVVDTGGNLPPVSLTPVTNLPPVSTTLLKLVAKFAAGVVDTGGKFAAGVVDTGGNFAAGVVDTGGKFATGVVDTGGQSLAANISANFRKKFETAPMVCSRAWGKLIHEKNQKQNIS
jgi:hypothetical protein